MSKLKDVLSFICLIGVIILFYAMLGSCTHTSTSAKSTSQDDHPEMDKMFESYSDTSRSTKDSDQYDFLFRESKKDDEMVEEFERRQYEQYERNNFR